MPLEPSPVTQAPELIFGLIAPIGVDLNMVSDVLGIALREMSYSVYVLRLTQLMRAIDIKISEDLMPSGQSTIDSYKERIAYANALRGRVDDSALAALTISAIRSFRQKEWQRRAETPPHPEEEPLLYQAYIIRQLKKPEEVMLLRDVYGEQFIPISAYAPREWRIHRLKRLEMESRGGLVSDSEAQARAAELVMQDSKESQDIHGQNIRDAFPLGDVFIDATSRANCEEMVRRFVRLLFGNNEITPTHDEYGAYLAKSASLRSSDLSRQVGAAIIRPSGEVLALGCNEVPKAGGGTYWAGDEPDARDFTQGVDPNELRKTRILVDLVDRLHKGGYLSESLMESTDTNKIARDLLDKPGVDSVANSKIMDLIEFGRIVHAEMSVLADVARKGLPVEGATLYCTTFPCHICTKLIVASGIKKVVYMEPYPKSYAVELYNDSIAVDSQKYDTKVVFNALLGVSPNRYRKLFEKRRRKDKMGNAQRWNNGEKRPVVDALYPSYFRAETYVVKALGDAIAGGVEKGEVSKRSTENCGPSGADNDGGTRV